MEIDMENTKKWWEKGAGKIYDLRKLFSDMICNCLSVDDPRQNIRWLDKEFKKTLKYEITTDSKSLRARPFQNTFREDLKKDNGSVFTEKPLKAFMMLCRCKMDSSDTKIRDEDSLKKAIELIKNYTQKRNFAHKLSDDSSLNYDLFLQCDNVIKNNCKLYDESCASCPGNWLSKTLYDIEENYDKLNATTFSYENYSDPEQKTLVHQLYDNIIEFENPKNISMESITELYNSCIRCYDIIPVNDYKLAYIKWFTAHFMIWPPLNYILRSLFFYDEFAVYKLLSDASTIMASLSYISLEHKEHDFEDLFTKIECDRIISSLTCAYMNPFRYTQLEPYNVEYVSNQLKNIKNSKLQSELYLHLWLYYTISMRSTKQQEVYTKKLEKLLKKSKPNDNYLLLLGARYALYNGFSKPTYQTKTLDLLQQILANNTIINDYKETIFTLNNLFNTHFNYGNQFTNPVLLTHSFSQNPMCYIDAPTQYIRLFGDYQLYNNKNFFWTHYDAIIQKLLETYSS